jgi:uncharacterized protein
MMLSPEQLQFGNRKYEDLPPVCLNCVFLNLCYGECPKNRFMKSLDGTNRLNYLCPGLKNYFMHTQKAMLFMANELAHGRPPANICKALASDHLL